MILLWLIVLHLVGGVAAWALGRHRVACRIACLVALDYARLRSVAQSVLTGEGIRDAKVSLAFVDNPTIHGINRRFLDHDEPTDVITFPLSGAGAKKLEGELVIGDASQRPQLGPQRFECASPVPGVDIRRDPARRLDIRLRTGVADRANQFNQHIEVLFGLNIALAKVNTEGQRVADVFYVRTEQGGKLGGAGQLADLSAALREVIRRLD